MVSAEKSLRREEALRLRKSGMTYSEIGRLWGISKQRVSEIAQGKHRRDKPGLDSKVMLKTRDVAQLLGVHVNTVRRWSNSGVLRAYRISSRGDRRFRREDIERFLEEGQIRLREAS